jgi:cell division protein FtsI (penicillin-binding protein 3)
MNRFASVALILFVFVLVILARSFQLQITDNEFFKEKSKSRHFRTVVDKTERGMIIDRNGFPLAVSTEMISVGIYPRKFDKKNPNVKTMLKTLNIPVKNFNKILKRKKYSFLKRHLTPAMGEFIKSLQIKGLDIQKETKRYYPAGSLISQIVGFTGIDNKGQEGLELFYDQMLRGKDGTKKVLTDRLGKIVEVADESNLSVAGIDLRLSLDKDIQFFVKEYLQDAINKNKAFSASAVVLNVKNGEVIAMMSLPTYNPNDMKQRVGDGIRNRIVTDVIEPGSVMKPFTMAVALLSQKVRTFDTVDTTPGFIQIGDRTVTDIHNLGNITISDIIKKSSNVGISKVALKVSDAHLWKMLDSFGFGKKSTLGFPGESTGKLPHYKKWNSATKVSLAYGYSLHVTLLQIARAYAAIATGGILKKTTLLQTKSKVSGKRVLTKKIAKDITKMLIEVTSADGTAPKAAIDGILVAGKTGTVKKVNNQGGYTEDKYRSIFAGFAPADNPLYVCVVMVDNPQGDIFYGGSVAAPVFAKIMKKVLIMPQLASNL